MWNKDREAKATAGDRSASSEMWTWTTNVCRSREGGQSGPRSAEKVIRSFSRKSSVWRILTGGLIKVKLHLRHAQVLLWLSALTGCFVRSWIGFSNLSQPQKALYKYSQDLVRRCQRARHHVTGNPDVMRSSLSFTPEECSMYSQANRKQIRLKHKILHYTDSAKVIVKGEVRLTVNTAAMGIAAFMKTVSRRGTVSVSDSLNLVNVHFKSK